MSATSPLLDQIDAALAQVRALELSLKVIRAAVADDDIADPEDARLTCPDCKATEHQALGGDVVACGVCGANYPGGKQ